MLNYDLSPHSGTSVNLHKKEENNLECKEKSLDIPAGLCYNTAGVKEETLIR